MKYTLLDMVQSILSRLDSDEVNSIGDTSEARQVAEIVRTKYFDIVARAHLPENSKLFQLTASGDDTLPIIMYKPDSIRSIEWIKYHRIETDSDIDDFQYVTILPLRQFLDMMHSLNPDDTTVDSLTFEDFTFYYRNDRTPTYCTVLDDTNVVFDAFDLAIDTTLQTSKTMGYGLTNPTFSMEDLFIPELDDGQFPLLLNEATSTAFVDLKQSANPKVEQEVKRQWSSLEKNKSFPKPNWFSQLPDFGRRGARTKTVVIM